ncbi:NEK protein kinase [Sphaeroforma arctica JP610]|uniref:non-specific serine/threonine protein kinase n=1 Tax=Sphaeroforma arctica JP610 TaxID=667725 RepID=A0A0L0FNH6_9EUKA|nr:NEK protein kinase [Sphaeroforma arctica JP610]KNC78352.1 NEK protein kinase [Sphaeroforma arctica JP610]|eukprot:XP_014152254.1 NEK protein kinase [Sphaeroforma arctica JP610]
MSASQSSIGAGLGVRSRASNKLYAVKQSNLSNQTEEDRLRILSEVDIICKLHHPHIARCKEAQLLFGSLWLVLEYAPGDIKSANILVFDKLRLKIGDFGMAKQPMDRSMLNTLVGTPEYLSPEMCRGEPYNSKTDVWSLGCVLSEIANGKPPYKGTNLSAVMTEICSGDAPYCRTEYSLWIIGLIRSMMHPYQSIRPEAMAIEELFRAGQSGDPEVVNLQYDDVHVTGPPSTPELDSPTYRPAAKSTTAITSGGGGEIQQGKSHTSIGAKKGHSIKKKIQKTLRPTKENNASGKKRNTSHDENIVADYEKNINTLADNTHNGHQYVHQTHSGSVHVSVGNARYKIPKSTGQSAPQYASTVVGSTEDNEIYGLLFGGFEGDQGSEMTDESTYTKLRVNLKSDYKQKRQVGKPSTTLSNRAHLRTGRDYSTNQAATFAPHSSSTSEFYNNNTIDHDEYMNASTQSETVNELHSTKSAQPSSKPTLNENCSLAPEVDANYLVWKDVKDGQAVHVSRSTSFPGSRSNESFCKRSNTGHSIRLNFDLREPHRRSSHRVRADRLSQDEFNPVLEKETTPSRLPPQHHSDMATAQVSGATKNNGDESTTLPTPKDSTNTASSRTSLRSERSSTQSNHTNVTTFTAFRKTISGMEKHEDHDTPAPTYENLTRVRVVHRSDPLPAQERKEDNNNHKAQGKFPPRYASQEASANRESRVYSRVKHIEEEERRFQTQLQADRAGEHPNQDKSTNPLLSVRRQSEFQQSLDKNGAGGSVEPSTYLSSDENSDEYYDPEIELCDRCGGDHLPHQCSSRIAMESKGKFLEPRSIRAHKDNLPIENTTKEVREARRQAPHCSIDTPSYTGNLEARRKITKDTNNSDDLEMKETDSTKFESQQHLPRQETTAHPPRGRVLKPRSARIPHGKHSVSVTQEYPSQDANYPPPSARPNSRSVTRNHGRRVNKASTKREEELDGQHIQQSRVSIRNSQQPPQCGDSHVKTRKDSSEHGKYLESEGISHSDHHQETQSAIKRGEAASRGAEEDRLEGVMGSMAGDLVQSDAPRPARSERTRRHNSSYQNRPKHSEHSYSGLDAIQPESPELYKYMCDSMGEDKVLSAIAFLRGLPGSIFGNDPLTKAVLKVLVSIIGEENEFLGPLLLEMIVPGVQHG